MAAAPLAVVASLAVVGTSGSGLVEVTFQLAAQLGMAWAVGSKVHSLAEHSHLVVPSEAVRRRVVGRLAVQQRHVRLHRGDGGDCRLTRSCGACFALDAFSSLFFSSS